MKIIKRILAVVSILLCLTFLCGCSVIEELRDNHATFVEGEDENMISYKGCAYQYLEFDVFDYMLGDFSKSITVAKKEVPLLLAEFYGYNGHLSGDEKIITLQNSDYYVRTDVYDDVVKEIENGVVYTDLGYEGWAFDDETFESGYKNSMLSDDEHKTIVKLFNEGEYAPGNYDDSKDFIDCVTVYGYSKSGVFRQDLFEVYSYEDGYTVEMYPEAYEELVGAPLLEECDFIVFKSVDDTDAIFEKMFR